MIKRDKYLNQLINNLDNGFPKVITGIRRCGKSYLLKDLDDDRNSVYRDPLVLGEYVREKCAEQTKLTFMHAKELVRIASRFRQIYQTRKHVPENCVLSWR